MPARRRIFLWVQSLRGLGHTVRAFHLARACAAAGAEVLVASGGAPPPGAAPDRFRLVQLTPLMANAQYTALFRPDGRPADPDMLAARRAMLLAALADFAPDIVVTETWPFGRGLLRAELEALEAACSRLRAKRAVSLRDIVEPPGNPDKATRAIARARGVDVILVHGEAAIAPLPELWPGAEALDAVTHYTFYLGPVPPQRPRGPRIVAAAGGGAFGAAMLLAALGARALGAAADRPWDIACGPNMGPDDLSRIEAAARGLSDVTVLRAPDDLAARFQCAALAISQCGYNAAAEIASAGTPAVFVPHRGEDQREQGLRADRFGKLFRARIAAAEPGALALAIAEALDDTDPRPRLALDSGARAAAVLMAL